MNCPEGAGYVCIVIASDPVPAGERGNLIC